MISTFRHMSASLAEVSLTPRTGVIADFATHNETAIAQCATTRTTARLGLAGRDSPAVVTRFRGSRFFFSQALAKE